MIVVYFFFFQAEDGIRVLVRSRGLGDVYKRQEWGRPQPETVRDYTIEAKCADGWQSLVDVKGNYQRRRVHKVKPSGDVSALRVTVTATNGLDHARIFEIRAY